MNGGLVTVFGGTGFVGRYVVKRLVDAGYRVCVAVRRPERALALKPMGVVGQVVPMQANVRMRPSVAAAVVGADAVVNLVGILHESGRQSFGAVHAQAAATIAAAAREAGVRRLVHISAIGASAQSDAEYARSKAAGEAAVREEFPGAIVLRPSIVFGPEDDFFNRFAAIARVSPFLPLIGGGHTRFQPIYVGDVASAVSAALQLDSAVGKTFELGGPRSYSFRELMEIVLRETGRNRLLLPLPVPLAMLQASVLQLLPTPPLTRDQVRMLAYDNVVSPNSPGLADLGVEPTALEGIVPLYLFRYRRGGGRVTPRSD